MQNLPPISTTAQSPILKASKWTCLQALLAPAEVSALFEQLSQPSLYLCGTLWPKENFRAHRELFQEKHRLYIEALSSSTPPDLSLCRTYFSACLTENTDTTYLQDVKNNEFMLRFTRPIIQLQHHTMSFSPHDGKMHSMVFGKDAISWGIQFSYPQMYLDSAGNVHQTTDGSNHPNSALFKTLQRWLRHNTLPTTFVAEGQKIATSIRLGKACCPWIKNHPQLISQGIEVALP